MPLYWGEKTRTPLFLQKHAYSFAGMSYIHARSTLPVSHASGTGSAPRVPVASIQLLSPFFFLFLPFSPSFQLLWLHSSFIHLQSSISRFHKRKYSKWSFKKVYYISESANSIYFKQSHIVFFSSFI